MSTIKLSSNFDDVVLDYLEFCEIEKNLSQNTIKMYHFYLTDFGQWSRDFLKKDVFSIEDIDDELVKKYRINLNRRLSSKSKMEYKRSTQKTFLVALRAFLKYLVVEKNLEILSPEKILLGKSEDRIPKFLNDQQMKKLFEVQNLDKKSGIRDKAIIETLYSTGLRVSELVALNRDEVNFDTGEFTVLGKGRKARIVYLSPEAIKWLKRYLATRADPFIPLFIRYSGRKMQENDFDGESLRINPRSIQRLIKKYVKRSGISVDATPHTLRHTYATGLLSEGADLREVQELLGHSNVSTTQIYTHVTNRQLREIHKKYHKDIIASGDNASNGEDESEDSVSSLG